MADASASRPEPDLPEGRPAAVIVGRPADVPEGRPEAVIVGRPADVPEGRPEAVIVGRPADVPEGGSILVTVGRREIGIYRVDGQFFGLLNRCPHLGGPLCAGQIVTDIVSPVPGDVRSQPGRTFVTCPWHNWEFDIRTGQSYWNGKLRAMPFPVSIEAGDAAAGLQTAGRAAGPYQAETIPVAVENEFLVLRLRPARPMAAEVSP